MRYKCWRAWPQVDIHVICLDDEAAFAALPEPIRHLGPWQGSREGEVASLKSHYRQLVEEQGFALLWVRPSRFQPEST